MSKIVDFVFLVADIAFLAYSLSFSYFWWLKSKEYIAMNVKKRRQYRRTLFFMPQVLLFDFYDQNPAFEKWACRIVGLIFILASLVGIVVSINGPFHFQR